VNSGVAGKPYLSYDIFMKRGLYIHIPFCRKKCHYCNFVSTTNRTAALHKKFISSIEKELQHAKDQYGHLEFDTFYIGGGTPSLLNDDEITKLVGCIRKHFNFRQNYEFTCEMNPEDVDEKRLAAYLDLGINRISLGAQAFQDRLLKETGRTHNAEANVKALDLLREMGCENISVDIMIRLPGQTVSDVEESILRSVELGAKQLTVYDLDIHEKTVFGVQQKHGKLHLPYETEHLQMFQLVEKILTDAGFVHYELMTFAKPGFESRHNLIYWHNEEYLGLGPGAFSYLNGIRYQFAKDVNGYFKKCAENNWTRDIEDILTEEEKESETLLTGLRLAEGIDFAGLKLLRPKIEKKIDELSSEGLFKLCGTKIAFTQRGRYSAETILSNLLP